jgi:hypothetical protein
MRRAAAAKPPREAAPYVRQDLWREALVVSGRRDETVYHDPFAGAAHEDCARPGEEARFVAHSASQSGTIVVSLRFRGKHWLLERRCSLRLVREGGGLLCLVVMACGGSHSIRTRPKLRVAALVFGWAASAQADPLAAVTVQLEAPPGCPDRAALDAELRRDLGGSQVQSERLFVHARVEQLGVETWHALVRTENEHGESERSLSARTCAALVDATSLIIAMLIDPETAATNAYPNGSDPLAAAAIEAEAATVPSSALPAASEDASIAVTTTPETKQPDRRPLSESQAAPAPRRRIQGFISAWAMMDAGSLPSVSGAFGGALGLRYGPWRGETSMGWWWPRSESWGGTPNPRAGGDFGMIASSAKLCCSVWSKGSVHLGPCAGMEAVRWSGVGNESLSAPNPQPTYRWAASAAVSVLGVLDAFRSLGLRLNLDVLVPLNRPEFGFTAGASQYAVFQPGWIALRAGVGVEWRFP